MSSIIKKLNKMELLTTPPACVIEPEFEVIMGSTAYGVTGSSSDVDVYSVCIPPVEEVFTHMNGMVPGFGPKPSVFKTWQQHHIKTEAGTVQEKEYDLCSYSMVEFFNLAAENNPNIIDSLFVPDRCITHVTEVGKVMRESRRLFLHKGAYHKFKGYAYSQLSKIKTRKPVGKRAELVEKFGYDVKFAYHVVRLAQECEQILMEGDLDLERCREMLKVIRKGEWTLEQLEEWFRNKELMLDQLYIDSKLQHKPDYAKLNRLLMVCLESKFGSLDNLMKGGVDQKALRNYEKIVRIIQG
jgi:predicted nucleotidyltransferase